MEKEKTSGETDRLISALRKTSNINTYLDKNKGQFNRNNLADYLNRLIQNNKFSRAEVIATSGIDRVYAYEILRSKKTPRRDTLLRLLISMKIGLTELQKALKNTGYATLYPRNIRDAIIIYGVEHNLTVIDLNILLDDSGQDTI
jgi:hypothetical protein